MAIRALTGFILLMLGGFGGITVNHIMLPGHAVALQISEDLKEDVTEIKADLKIVVNAIMTEMIRRHEFEALVDRVEKLEAD